MPGPSPSFRNIARFVSPLIAAYLLCEILIFHSGLYARFLHPDLSATGYLERVLSDEVHRPPTAKKEILVVGNSRIAEGFSAKVANEYRSQDGFWFANLGVSGSGDRVWYYLVRDVDPHRDRYAAIAIPIDDYDDPDDYEDVADRASEMPLLANRLTLADIVPYAMSFTTWKSRGEVLRGWFFLGLTYQRDFQLFFEHPTRRLRFVADMRAHGAQNRYDYLGINRSLAGMKVDWVNRRVTGLPADLQRDYESRLFSRPPQLGRNYAFEARWLGALVDLYRNSKTRIVIFQAPRGPAPRPVPLARLKWTIVDELRKRPWVRVIDRHQFEDLERSELFADHVHLNSTGRKLFSPRLAEAIKNKLP